MSIKSLFPTTIFLTQAPPALRRKLNPQLSQEARSLRILDETGKKWCRKNYTDGYTSYGSITDLPFRSSTFSELKVWIDSQARKFAKSLEFDLMGGRLEMTTCWVNIMGKHCAHAYHLHPLSTLSGTYYVDVPPGSGALKLEDPRIAGFMASPPRKTPGKAQNRRYFELTPQPGQLILFESWLKHEVPPNKSSRERISISFNYDWIR